MIAASPMINRLKILNSIFPETPFIQDEEDNCCFYYNGTEIFILRKQEVKDRLLMGLLIAEDVMKTKHCGKFCIFIMRKRSIEDD